MRNTVCILALIVTVGALAALPIPAVAKEGPPLSGTLEQFSLIDPPRPAPQTPFVAGDGTQVSMADFEGRVLLVNFWATWCAPCVRELPSLDRLQAALQDEGLLVLAISQDRRGAEVAGPFLKKLGIENLGLFLDSKMKLGREFGVRALPWTVVIDRDGRIVGELPGIAEWDAPESLALMRYYLRQGKPPTVDKASMPAAPQPDDGSSGQTGSN